MIISVDSPDERFCIDVSRNVASILCGAGQMAVMNDDIVDRLFLSEVSAIIENYREEIPRMSQLLLRMAANACVAGSAFGTEEGVIFVMPVSDLRLYAEFGGVAGIGAGVVRRVIDAAGVGIRYFARYVIGDCHGEGYMFRYAANELAALSQSCRFVFVDGGRSDAMTISAVIADDILKRLI